MRILLLSTYPVSGVESGGVVRLKSIVEALNQAGHQTHVLAIVPPLSDTFRSSRAETVIPLVDGAFSDRDFAAIGYHDTLIGIYAATEKGGVLERASVVEKSFDPELIIVEQPFLIELAEALAARTDAPIVYSAANHEHALKKALIDLVPEPYDHPLPLLEDVQRLEDRAIRGSALVVAITSDMQAFLQDKGAKRVVVAGNGSRVANAAPGGSLSDSRFTADSDQLLFGCFGSSYWPNSEGLAAVTRPSLAFLPPNGRLVTTGRLGQALKDHPSYRRGRRINDSRLLHYDHLDGAAYEALVRSCDLLLLPVFVGGGSPLKTADALASGKPVLLTRKMTSGYDDILATNADGVTLVDDPAQFRERWLELARLGRSGLRNLQGRGGDRKHALTWRVRLAPLIAAIGELEKR